MAAFFLAGAALTTVIVAVVGLAPVAEPVPSSRVPLG